MLLGSGRVLHINPVESNSIYLIRFPRVVSEVEAKEKFRPSPLFYFAIRNDTMSKCKNMGKRRWDIVV